MTCYKLIFKNGTIEYIPAYYAIKNDDNDEVIFLTEHNEVMIFGNVDKLYEVVQATRIVEVES